MSDHPTVTGSPDEIWLVYGDIERDATHAEVLLLGEVSWCGDQINDSDVRYVRADIADRAQLATLPQSASGLWIWQSASGERHV